VVYFFFFFQAEDGIRDKLVTGVQTCALPISWYAAVLTRLLDLNGFRNKLRSCVRLRSRHSSSVSASYQVIIAETRSAWSRLQTRSEERRVGKEGRSGWVTVHKKKRVT